MKAEERKKIYDKYNGRCAYCGCEIKIKDMQVDHIIPKLTFEQSIKMNYKIPSFLSHLTLDDLNHFDNLNPACRQCNFYKSANNLELFRNNLKSINERIMKPFISRLGEKYGIVKINNWDEIFYFEKLTNDKLKD